MFGQTASSYKQFSGFQPDSLNPSASSIKPDCYIVSIHDNRYLPKTFGILHHEFKLVGVCQYIDIFKIDMPCFTVFTSCRGKRSG